MNSTHCWCQLQQYCDKSGIKDAVGSIIRNHTLIRRLTCDRTLNDSLLRESNCHPCAAAYGALRMCMILSIYL